ncbi:MAG: tRNA-dihydrouridine synthase, partial [Brevundimonas sp.]|nr:tRNA-dihydrouridine synthase [Brevundimonas sp.]
RGVYGRPWLAAHLERALADGTVMEEPGREDRLAIVIDHLRASVAFYGMPLGLKMFRKHLGWYVEQAPWPADPLERRSAKARLCRLDTPEAVEAALAGLWRPVTHSGNSAVDIEPQFAEAGAA